MKTVAFHNLGCKVNSYELDVMQQRMSEKGYKIVSFDTPADIYIINTCTVTNIADRKSRQMLHRAKKKNPKAIVVAVGCYVQTAGEALQMDDAIDLAVGNNKKGEIARIVEDYLEGHLQEADRERVLVREVIDINHTNEYEEMQLEQTAEHTRAYIKIQDGCNQFCSYCIIPFARGRVRSRKQEDILQEVQGLAEKGYREVVLTGIHISSYGIDWGESRLLDLITAIHGVEGIERIRLGSLEPRIVTAEFADAISNLPKVCPHFHLSLQSGCDATLQRMNRKYTAAEYMEGVRQLRRVYGEPAITTDVIVGFPGETEQEFAECKAFLQNVNFYEMHIFKYSVRQGTRAAGMPHQIPEPVKAQRSDSLIALEAEMSRAYRAKALGQELDVLFEEAKEIQGELYQIGHTKTYVKVALKTTENLSNQIVRGVLSAFLTPEILLMDCERERNQ